MDKKFHYLYKVTHKASGRIYIGIHSTDDLDDRYFACGTYRAADPKIQDWSRSNHAFENPNHIVNSLIKYGPDAFTREILKYRDSREEILALEAEIVDEDFVKKKSTFNQRSGGQGSFFSDATRELISKNNPMHRDEVRKKVSEAGKERWTDEKKQQLSRNNPMYHDENLRKLSGENSVWLGRSHSQETLDKISQVRKKQNVQTTESLQKAADTMRRTSKKLTQIEDLKTGKVYNSLQEVQKVLLDDYNLEYALSTISIHLKDGAKIKSKINETFKFKKRKISSEPTLRLKKRGGSYGFHVWLPWAKKYYKRSLATTDKEEAERKLQDIQLTFWDEPERKKKLAEFRAKPIVGGGGEKKRAFWRENFEITDQKTNEKFNSYEALSDFIFKTEGVKVSKTYLSEIVNGRKRDTGKPKDGSLKHKLKGRFVVTKNPRSKRTS